MHKLNTAVLFSGGKDSCLALSYALDYSNVKCLIIMESENNESYMFHTPNIRWAVKQAEAIGIPAIVQKTKGEKEEELEDLEKAIRKAIDQYEVQAVVTGAIGSIYQALRVQRITNKLKIECFNPLWQKDQLELLKELVDKKFDVVIVGVFGYGMEPFLGRRIDQKFIEDISKAKEKLKINPAGEGGEFESFTLHAPFFQKKLAITKSHIVKDKEGGQIMFIDELGDDL